MTDVDARLAPLRGIQPIGGAGRPAGTRSRRWPRCGLRINPPCALTVEQPGVAVIGDELGELRRERDLFEKIQRRP
jgi:hypothetical protein